MILKSRVSTRLPRILKKPFRKLVPAPERNKVMQLRILDLRKDSIFYEVHIRKSRALSALVGDYIEANTYVENYISQVYDEAFDYTSFIECTYPIYI